MAEPPVAHSPIGMVRAGLAALAEADVAVLPDQQVRDEVLALMACANQLGAVVAERIGSFDLRDLSDTDAVRTTLSWLRIFGRMTQTTASAWLARARLLRDLPAVAGAAKAGAISAGHLGPIRRLVKDVGIAAVRDFDQVLADLAAAAGPAEVAVACARLRAHLDPDGRPPDPEADFERRELSVRPVGSMLQIRGRLDAEGGAALTTAIDALMRPPTPDDERSTLQRRADALVDLARGSIANGDLPTVGGVRPSIGILVTPQALIGTGPPDTAEAAPAMPAAGAVRAGPGWDVAAHGGRAPENDSRANGSIGGDDDWGRDPLTRLGVPPRPDSPWMSWIGEVPPEVAQRIACDADVWRIVMDPGRGLPLDVGRAYRLVPPWMRRALHVRDRTCRWPGCDAPAAWCDAHHLVPWQHGGTTDITKIISVCRYHHVKVHEGKWRLRLDDVTGHVHVRRPDGRAYEPGLSQPWTGTSRLGPPPRPAGSSDRPQGTGWAGPPSPSRAASPHAADPPWPDVA